jgi:hypothetical protein
MPRQWLPGAGINEEDAISIDEQESGEPTRVVRDRAFLAFAQQFGPEPCGSIIVDFKCVRPHQGGWERRTDHARAPGR